MFYLNSFTLDEVCFCVLSIKMDSGTTKSFFQSDYEKLVNLQVMCIAEVKEYGEHQNTFWCGI